MWRAVTVVCLGMAVVGMGTTAVGVATGGVADELDTSLEALEWIMGAYLVAGAAFSFVGGRLGDIIGRKRTLVLGLAVLTVGSVAAALAPGSGALIGARAVQGLGAALVLPASIEVVVAYAGPRGPSSGFRARGVVYAASFGIGPLVGGVLTDRYSWRAVFWAEVVLLVVALVLSIPLLVERSTVPKGPTRDVRGALIVTALVAVGVTAASRLRHAGLASPLTLAVVAAMAALAWLLWTVESRTRHPLVHPGLLTDRVVLGANVATIGASVSMVGLVYFFAVFAQSAAGFDAGAVGIALALLPFTASIVVCALVAAALSDRVGPRGPVLIGLGLAVGGFAVLSTTGTGTTEADLLLPLAVCGIGAGIANAGLTGPAVLLQRRARIDEAAGLVSLTRFLGAALAIAIGTSTYLSVVVGAVSATDTGTEPEVVAVGAGGFDDAVASLAEDLRAPFRAVVAQGTVDAFAATMRITAIGLGVLTAVSAWLLSSRPVEDAAPSPSPGGDP